MTIGPRRWLYYIGGFVIPVVAEAAVDASNNDDADIIDDVVRVSGTAGDIYRSAGSKGEASRFYCVAAALSVFLVRAGDILGFAWILKVRSYRSSTR